MLFTNGRVVNGIIYYLFTIAELPATVVYFISYASALFFLTLSICVYGHILYKVIKNTFLSAFLAFIIIVNPFSIEYFLFIEKGLFFCAIFLCTLASYFTIRFFNTNSPKYLLDTLIALIFAVFMYQISLGLYVILCLPFVISASTLPTEEANNNRFLKPLTIFIKRNIILALMYGLVLGSAYFVTDTLFKSERVTSRNSFSFRVFPVLSNLIKINKDPYYHLPNNYLLLLYLLIFIYIVVVFIHSKKTYQKVFLFFSLLYVTIGTTLISLAPFILGVTNDYACRTIYPFGAIWGIMIATVLKCSSYGITSAEEKTASKRRLYYVFAILLFSISVNYILFRGVFIDRYKSNQTDKYICQMVGERIKEYEEETGKKITTICFYKDQSLTWGIDGAFQNGLLDRAHAIGWSRLDSINYYLASNYAEGNPSEKYKQYFLEYNWNFYSDRQLIFEGDTLHFCVY
ncbi:MAG: glucosyltransferase domain-containing protein [Lachnospiraceae bacterium]|nr:glucosyltransferase domain-containing protein [Lachnospiraceae bacterium]